MKKIALGLFAVAALASCKPEPFEEIGPNHDLRSGVDGEWKVDHVEVIDLTRPVPENRDITDFFVESEEVLSLSFNSEQSTYSVSDPDLPGNFFGDGGSYTFVGGEFPEEMLLIPSSGDTVRMSLMNMVRSIDNQMGLRLNRDGCEKAYAAYEFTFNRK